MRQQYLEVTYRKGRVIAAYLYLPRPAGTRSATTIEVAPGLLADLGSTGAVIGLEITAPGQVSLATINSALKDLSQPPIDAAELSPLQVA